MNLSIIIIGDEILLGRVTDTNSGLIARTFTPLGWNIKRIRTVGDNGVDITSAINESLAESELVIATGGLGPTRDDITKSVMMDIFGGSLVHNAEVAANVEAVFARRQLKMNELTASQAMVPSSAKIIENLVGTAPIMVFERQGRMLVAMPGVPAETRGMLPSVAKVIAEHFGSQELTPRQEFTVTGIIESALAERLSRFEDSMPKGFKLAYLPSAKRILLRLEGTPGASTELFEDQCRKLVEALGEYMSAQGDVPTAAIVLERLRKNKLTLATAESCTGGNIAHLLTLVPGSSDVFNGGVVSYANEVKTNILGVDSQTLATEGAVSEATVLKMLSGAKAACRAQCAVATSGIAGPGGAVPGKPVGTVWIGASTPQGTDVRLWQFGGDRQAVIDRASATAFDMLLRLL